MKKILLAISVVMIFILTGCYLPEKFTARVDVHKDGSYTMTYDGTMINLVAWEGIGNGKKNLEDEKMLQKEVNNIGKDPEVKHIEYLGSGRYRISIEKRRKSGQRGYIFGRDIKVIQAIPLKGGVLQVYVDDMKSNDIRELKSLGLKVDGKLIVSVPEGMEVLGSNADRTPSIFGLFGDYEWDINSFDRKIDIRLRPKEKLVNRDSSVSQKAIDSTEVSGCLEYNKPYTFKGKIVKKIYYDDETGNHNYLALELYKPICTLPKEYSRKESEITYMQISSGGSNKVQKLEGKHVELKGSLYHSDNAHHFTKVLISLKSIERKESSSKSVEGKDLINSNSNFSQEQARSYKTSNQHTNPEREELEQLKAEKAMAERKELEQLRAEKAKKFVLADETLCSSSDVVVFSCHIKEKILSVCQQKNNKFVYKYGKPHKVELTISSKPLFSHNQFIRMNVESRLRFHNKGYDYIVYSNDLFTYDKHPNDGTGVYKSGHGVYVVKNNKLLAELKCNKIYPHMKDIYRLRNSFRHEKYSFLNRR